MKVAITLFFCLLLLVQPASSGIIAYGICQAGCAGVATACFTAAGGTLGVATVAVIALSPALTACNIAYGFCYKTCYYLAYTTLL